MFKRAVCWSVVITGLAVGAVAAQQTATNDEQGKPPERRAGRLWNLSPRPITYQLARNTGRPWTAPLVLQPNQYHELRGPAPGQRSVLLGLNQRDPFVGVRFDALGGVITVRLPARNSEGELLPNWFFITDSNDTPRLVQANDPDDARRQYEQLKQARPLTAENIERFKATLRANHVFADGR